MIQGVGGKEFSMKRLIDWLWPWMIAGSLMSLTPAALGDEAFE